MVREKEYKRERMQWADAIKGIAIIGVVLVHSGGNAVLPFPLNKVCENGDCGVQAFFILATFLTMYSFRKWKENGKKIGGWYLNRLIRLLPPYYLALLVKFLIYGNGTYGAGDAAGVTFGNVVSHIFMLHGFSPYHINSVLGIEWYLANYAILIMIIPILVRWVNNTVKACAFVLGSSLSCYFIILVAQRLFMGTNAAVWEPYINSFGFWTQLPAIALGTLLFALANSDAKRVYKNNKAFSLVLLCASAYGLLILILGASFRGLTQETVFALVIFGIIFSQFIHPTPIISNAVFRSLGKHSYIIYLFHYFIFDFFDVFIRKGAELTVALWLVRVVFAIGITWVLSVLYGKAESFFMKKRKKKMEKIVVSCD